ncbi:hypothetical protein [Arenimonas daejeonensis]|uniref:hypothetical protein n=1 Tax=Arenimonas daejeonensis TaxID=370777 RepID=UPI0011BD98A2|nr:hypothetical protein [Arenimonas daejeonensis]
MAGYGQDKRLEALETEMPERPPIMVLSADWDGAGDALAAYYARTPEEERAETVVVVLGS